METIVPITHTRANLKSEVPPGSAPEVPGAGFARVMARQEGPGRKKESLRSPDQEGSGPKTPLTAPTEDKRESGDPASAPEIAASLVTLIPTPPLPGQPDLLRDAGAELEKGAKEPTPFLKIESSLNFGFQPRPESFPLPVTDPGSGLSIVALSKGPGEGGPLGEALLRAAAEVQKGMDFHSRELALQGFPGAPENAEKAASREPLDPGPTAAADRTDPPPSLVFQGSPPEKHRSLPPLPGNSAGSRRIPAPGSPQGEKGFSEGLPGGLPIQGARPVEAQVRGEAALRGPAVVEPSKDTPLSAGLSSLAGLEARPDAEKVSPGLSRTISGPSFLERALLEKVEPGTALKDPGENPTGSGEPEPNIPFRLPGDHRLGGITEVPDPSRIEAVTDARSLERLAKGSSEWIKEAESVYQQFSKGLLRTLQNSGERIQMTLDPPELGTLLMEINRERNLVTAHLWTDNPRSKELLEFSQGQLQKTLELDGFKLDRFEVLLQPDLKSFQEERWFGGRQPAWETSREGGGRAAPEEPILTPPEETAARFSRGNRYVDTWA